MTPHDIRATRTQLGMSQQQFATALNVSVSAVTKWEAGRAAPRPLAIEAIRRLRQRLAPSTHR